MNQKSGLILTIVASIFCGLPGLFSTLGGILVAGFGFSADQAQLKLDTNLNRSSVIWTGLGGVFLGAILIAIPVLLWLWSKRR